MNTKHRTTKNRQCLRCGKSFKSTSPANRICHHCTKRNAKLTQREIVKEGESQWD